MTGLYAYIMGVSLLAFLSYPQAGYYRYNPRKEFIFFTVLEGIAASRPETKVNDSAAGSKLLHKILPLLYITYLCSLH
ncbi:hypothetical protein J2S74_005409 [Evansella vedderi]|uniref:Uncharacterized protein n=1 Tax=Evansella vedderi TaxID=38282 RepID=A0ABU0A381_9BACI|nr:hypothetical protein [Evansella vedderi]